MFKLKILITICFLIFIESSLASVQDYSDKIDLKKELEINREKYERKFELCNSLGVYAGELDIKNSWFNSLDNKDKVIVLRLLRKKTDYECFKQEENAYVLSLVDYAIYSGDKQPLEYWIDMNDASSLSEFSVDRLKNLDQTKLNDFFESQQPFMPFDYDKTVKKYLFY